MIALKTPTQKHLRSFYSSRESDNNAVGSFKVGDTVLSQSQSKFRKVLLQNLAKFTGKHLCQSLVFNKAAGFGQPLKKRLRQKCFPVNFLKFLRAAFLKSTSRDCLYKLIAGILKQSKISSKRLTVT